MAKGSRRWKPSATPESTRASLGVAPELITELLGIDTFRRVWESLAPESSAMTQ